VPAPDSHAQASSVVPSSRGRPAWPPILRLGHTSSVARASVEVGDDTIPTVTTREKVDKLLDRLSEAEHQAEYERLLAALDERNMVSLPEGWGQTRTGEPMPNVVAALHRSRASH